MVIYLLIPTLIPYTSVSLKVTFFWIVLVEYQGYDILHHYLRLLRLSFVTSNRTRGTRRYVKSNLKMIMTVTDFKTFKVIPVFQKVRN